MSAILRHAGDAERRSEEWGTLTWLVSAALTGNSDLTVGRVTIKAGRSNPRHSHANCDEVLHLLCGKLEHWVAAERYELAAGDTLVIPRGVPHHAVALGPEDADMVVVYNSGRRAFKRED
jgi:quercetin dioxygenase-like cupin family protein